MEQGRGGMGSHKHGISGESGPNRRTRRLMVREMNQESDKAASMKNRRKNKMYNDIKDLFRNR